MRSDADRIGDILEAIAKIKQRTPDTVEAFLQDELARPPGVCLQGSENAMQECLGPR